MYWECFYICRKNSGVCQKYHFRSFMIILISKDHLNIHKKSYGVNYYNNFMSILQKPRKAVDHPLLGSSTGTRKEQVQIHQPEILAFTDPSLCMGLWRMNSPIIRNQRVVRRLENWHWLWMAQDGGCRAVEIKISYNLWTWCTVRLVLLSKNWPAVLEKNVILQSASVLYLSSSMVSSKCEITSYK
jgi:hypothetical protein